MYTKQHGLEKNLFLAPGEGDEEPVAESEERPAVPGGVRDALGILRGGRPLTSVSLLPPYIPMPHRVRPGGLGNFSDGTREASP